jgi:hypothetical protein
MYSIGVRHYCFLMPVGVASPFRWPGVPPRRVSDIVVGEARMVARVHDELAGGGEVFAWPHRHLRAIPNNTAPQSTLVPRGRGEPPTTRRPTCILVRLHCRTTLVLRARTLKSSIY